MPNQGRAAIDLVGSVPLGSVEEVMRTCAGALQESCARVIDRFGTFGVLSASYAIGALLLLFAGLNFNSLASPALLGLLAIAGFFILGSYGGINVVLVNYYACHSYAVPIGVRHIL